MKTKPYQTIFASTVITTLIAAGSLQAATIATISDNRPGRNFSPYEATTTAGSVTSTAAVPTSVYTVTGLDLSSYGGGASESLVFNILYTQSGGTAVQINTFGNISVTGGPSDNQVDGLEIITATVSFNEGSSTFTGDFADLSVGFVSFTTGAVGINEAFNITTDSGTQLYTSPTSGSSPGSVLTTFDLSSLVTLDPVTGDFNVTGFDVQITAVPEPSSTALLGLGGLALILRRRR